MKKFLPAFITAGFLLASALPVFAAMPIGGQLIKASGPAVYYMGMDGKRYVFPNEATYRSWYQDFSSVQTITDTELSQIMIGGNVTYRPGTRLVKITTDPKVYAIAGNGTLRWVSTEALAISLFGSTWATQVDDIPDAFFVNYHVGADLRTSGDYDRNQELTLSATISADRGRGTTPPAPVVPPAPIPTPDPVPTAPTSTTPTTPTTSSTPAVPGSVSTSTSPQFQGSISLQGTQAITSGSSYSVIARPTPSGGLISIRLWNSAGTIVSCDTDYCIPRFVAPVTSATTTETITGVFNWGGPQTATTTFSFLVVPIRTSNQITLSSASTTIREGNTREVTVSIENQFTPHLINLFMDNALVKQCSDDQLCTISEPERSPLGTRHVFTATAENIAGEIINSAPLVLTVGPRA